MFVAAGASPSASSCTRCVIPGRRALGDRRGRGLLPHSPVPTPAQTPPPRGRRPLSPPRAPQRSAGGAGGRAGLCPVASGRGGTRWVLAPLPGDAAHARARTYPLRHRSPARTSAPRPISSSTSGVCGVVTSRRRSVAGNPEVERHAGRGRGRGLPGGRGGAGPLLARLIPRRFGGACAV